MVLGYFHYPNCNVGFEIAKFYFHDVETYQQFVMPLGKDCKHRCTDKHNDCFSRIGLLAGSNGIFLKLSHRWIVTIYFLIIGWYKCNNDLLDFV